MKLSHAVLLAFAVSFAGCGGCTRTEDIGTSKEVMSESIQKTGDTWHVNFKTKIDAPPDRVYEAFSQPERAHEYAPEQVLKSELVSQNGNVKVVDIVGKLDILPPGFKVQNLRNEYTMHPDTKTITSKSVGRRTRSMHAASTSSDSVRMSGYSRATSAKTRSQNAMLKPCAFDFVTDVNSFFLLRRRARSNANRMMRSVP